MLDVKLMSLCGQREGVYRARIDTGADGTTISRRVALDLGLDAIGWSYAVDLHGDPYKRLVVPAMIEFESDSVPFEWNFCTDTAGHDEWAGSGFDILLGMDLVTRGTLVIHRYAGTKYVHGFTMSHGRSLIGELALEYCQGATIGGMLPPRAQLPESTYLTDHPPQQLLCVQNVVGGDTFTPGITVTIDDTTGNIGYAISGPTNTTHLKFAHGSAEPSADTVRSQTAIEANQTTGTIAAGLAVGSTYYLKAFAYSGVHESPAGLYIVQRPLGATSVAEYITVAAPNVVVSVLEDGDCALHITGDDTTQSIKWAFSTSSMPNLATVQGQTAVNSSSVSDTINSNLTHGQRVYVAALAYSATDGAGTESPLGLAEATRARGSISAPLAAAAIRDSDGSVDINITGADGTQSIRYATSTSAMPSLATAQAASATDAGSVSANVGASVALGGSFYMRALAYTGTGGSGIESPSALVQTTRSRGSIPAPTMSAAVQQADGSVDLHIAGGAGTASIKYATSTSAMPSDSTVRAASATDAGSITANVTAAMTAGDSFYAKAFAYTATSGGGVESPAALAQTSWPTPPGRYRCKLINTSFTVTGTNQSVTFPTEIFDVGGLHDTGSDTNRITIPSTNISGVWQLIAQVTFLLSGGTSDGQLSVNILDQDGLTVGTNIQPYISNASLVNQTVIVTAFITDPDPGDWFEVKAGKTTDNDPSVLAYFSALHLW